LYTLYTSTYFHHEISICVKTLEKSDYFFFFRNRSAQACDASVCYSAVMDNYQVFFLTLLALIFFHTSCQTFYDGDNDITVPRRKRYVVFPLGSTFSVSCSNVQCTGSKLALTVSTCSLITKYQFLRIFTCWDRITLGNQ
jgi:hypothetical protein